jgi:hypothetical protein
MSKYTLLFVTLLVVALPTFALAAWNATSCSSYPQCQALSQEMNECKTPVNVSCSQMNQQNVMCPMVMPCDMKVENTDMFICPMKAEEPCPAQVKTVTMMVPVSIREIKSKNTITCNMDSKMAGSVVLIPMSSNGQQMMEPCQVKQASDNAMILVPLDKSMTSANVALIIDGSMVLAPVDTSASYSNDAMCLSSDAQGQTKVMCDKNDY